MRVVVVHNPSSGDTDVVRHELVELISRSGHDVAYFESDEPWEAELRQRPDLVCVAGGDGTVAPVARLASQHRLPVTILPIGTANNVAQFLGLQGVPFDELVGGWSRARHQPFDLGVAKGSWGEYQFLESVGVGLIARLIAEVDMGDAAHVNDVDHRAGRIEAALAVLKDLVNRAEPILCQLCGDDFTLSGEYLLVEVMNFGAAGPNLKLAPAGDGADGLLDVVVAQAADRHLVAEYLAVHQSGDHAGTSPLHVYRTRRVRVRCPKQIVHLDDALRTESDSWLTIDASIDPHAVTFLIPAVAQRQR